jgi:hypothetical protein
LPEKTVSYLLAAEITAVIGHDPGLHYRALTEQFGDPVYERADVVATPNQKAALERLSPEMVAAQEMAGEKIIGKLTSAPFNHAPIGGLKVVTENGWFAARPSGTEYIYKIYFDCELTLCYPGGVVSSAKHKSCWILRAWLFWYHSARAIALFSAPVRAAKGLTGIAISIISWLLLLGFCFIQPG